MLVTTQERFKIKVLGCGTSTGVPLPGCDCTTCNSTNPKNRRFRTSAIITTPSKQHILIDAGPDLTHQALKFGVKKIDALIYTHAHSDHILGTDDLRCFNFAIKAAIPAYATKECSTSIRKMFSYIFDVNPNYQGGSLAKLDFHEINYFQGLELCGLTIMPLQLHHGGIDVVGLRIGDFAYLTDCKVIPDKTLSSLAGVKTLFLDALRDKPHGTHLSIQEAIEYSQKIGASQTYFIHMGHEIEFERDSAKLPAGFQFAYDGMEVSV